MDPIDERVLADFLAGRLSPAQRAEVIQHLAANESSRELLRMAYLALEAARAEEGGARIHTLPRRAPDAAEGPRPRLHPLRNVSRIAAAVAVLVLVGGVLRLTLAPPADQVRNRFETEQALALEARISPRSLDMSWSAVVGADHYEVMVWDEEAAREVASEEVTDARLSAGSPFATRLRPLLEPGKRYALRVTAFDDTHRRIAASELVSFRFEP